MVKAGLFSSGQVLAPHSKVGSNNTESSGQEKKISRSPLAPGAKRRASESGSWPQLTSSSRSEAKGQRRRRAEAGGAWGDDEILVIVRLSPRVSHKYGPQRLFSYFPVGVVFISFSDGKFRI